MGRYDNIKDESTFKKQYKTLSKRDLIKFLSDANMTDEIDTKSATKPELVEFVKNYMGYKKGGDVFPDLSGDGKITQKDILMGRGVVKKSGGGNIKTYSNIQLSGRNFSGQY